jgi:undecaprenyl-diphosphatase
VFLEINNFIKYILLGLIQGITEPLPISSSGHLQIFKSIFGLHLEGDINFDIFVNFGSLLAIIFYYRLFLKDIIGGAFRFIFQKDKEKKDDFLYCLLVIVATIPAGIAGLLLKDVIDNTFSSLLSVGICLFITGLLLLFIHNQAKNAHYKKITLKTSILMGLAQIIGLFPGISRSGSTTSIGVLNKTDLNAALRFSFMMYIPISLASLLLGLLDFDASTTYIPGYLGAFVVSIFGTYYAIKYFFKLVQKNNLRYFGYYCLTVSLAVLFYLALIK